MNRRTFRARVESLEAREVLSSAGLIPIHGHGTGSLVAQKTIPNGSYETLSTLKGTSRVLGSFTGEVVLAFASDQFHAPAGLAEFVDANKNVVLANVSGAFRVPRHGVTHMSGTFRLTIVAGSGPYAGATGGGTLYVSQNVENGNLKFSIDAAARP